jgi:hypothetical protein
VLTAIPPARDHKRTVEVALAGSQPLLLPKLDWLKHAFAVEPPGATQPTDAERALVDRLAGEIVRRRLTAPALMLLEMSRPLNYVSAQFLHFVHPFLSVFGQGPATEQIARFLEKRGALEFVADRLEQLETGRRQSDAARRKPPAPPA